MKQLTRRERATATAEYMQKPKRVISVGPICACMSFNLPHELKRHNELRNDMDWRTEGERRGMERWAP